MITFERDLDRVIGVRVSASAVIFDLQGRLLLQLLQQRSDGGQWGDETLALAWVKPGRLPPTLLPNHRIRIRDARARRVAPFVR